MTKLLCGDRLQARSFTSAMLSTIAHFASEADCASRCCCVGFKAYRAARLPLELDLSFRRFGCRKFSIPVGFGARGPRVQFTDFADGCATSWARHRQYLLRSEIFGLHNCIVQCFSSGKMFTIAHLGPILEAGRLSLAVAHLFSELCAKVNIFPDFIVA
jgi:hypothetical protein